MDHRWAGRQSRGLAHKRGIKIAAFRHLYRALMRKVRF
jgi:hypothetical protein